MFRKPKKSITSKAGLRRQRTDDDGEPDETDLLEARRQATGSKRLKIATEKPVMHHFEASQSAPTSQKELATSTNEHLPTKVIDRGNKLLAGPIKAPTNIRTTCRFDYQPDICKDYKDTGFCGFGDTCIYLHDRGDTLSGWQLELQWQQEQEIKKKKQQDQMDEFMSGKAKNESNFEDNDGLPFACYLCRNHFSDPVVTNCGHYFCQTCLLKHVQEASNLCPICNKDTHGVFHEPTKLLSKKRKVTGRESTWEDFHQACQQENKESQEE